MKRDTSVRHARRSLLILTILIVALAGLLIGGITRGSATAAPKLGLDLKGGTQLILEPVTAGQAVTPEQLNQARDIIVQRVDSGGVSGAEVTTQGGRNIVVSIPEVPSEATKQAIQRSSQMNFRPVLVAGAGTPVPSESPSPSASAKPSGSAKPSASSSPKPSASASPTPNASANAQTGSPSASPAPSSAAEGEAITPIDKALNPALVTEADQAAYDALDCTKPEARKDIVDVPAKPLVTCNQDGAEKYILGPVVVSGADISDASAGYQSNSQGTLTSTVEIALTFNSKAASTYFDVSKAMVAAQPPSDRLAATLDSEVIVAPGFNEAIPGGRASITGGFTLEQAKSLADQLKFGALPLSFALQQSVDISPTLGSEQLRFGLLAGLVGLLLVVVYSMFQYRMLGLVTIASVTIAALLTYLTVTILGWTANYRLDMAGVTGLIVAIGFTADSFIVYFERVRDEVREGRSLASAVDTGWKRAKRTILAADGVNILAAVVLYLLATSNVRGFAFTLGLTTLIDIAVVFLFTHPVVALLARIPFFRDGHPWSGLDPKRLGATAQPRYRGRGRFGSPVPAMAEGGDA